MDGQQDRNERTGQRRKLGKVVCLSYLITGTALAISRVALYVWLTDVYVGDTVFPETVPYALWALNPEALLGQHTSLGLIHVTRAQAILMWGAILTVGSFIMATPVLLLGWLIRRRR
jgi:hypothetical protein